MSTQLILFGFSCQYSTVSGFIKNIVFSYMYVDVYAHDHDALKSHVTP